MIGLQSPQTALAFPPLPSSVYGTVKVNAANVPDGTLITASINGRGFAEGQTHTYQGNSVYSLDIPGDDSSTTAVEGGREGDTIVFTVGGVEASQTGVWQSGTNKKIDLTVSTSATLVPPQATPTLAPTQTPIIVLTPATAMPTTQAQATPIPTQTPISVVNTPMFTETTQSQDTPVTSVLTQASAPPTARNQAAQGISTETDPENPSANTDKAVVFFVILFALCILLFILWSREYGKPKEKK